MHLLESLGSKDIFKSRQWYCSIDCKYRNVGGTNKCFRVSFYIINIRKDSFYFSKTDFTFVSSSVRPNCTLKATLPTYPLSKRTWTTTYLNYLTRRNHAVRSVRRNSAWQQHINVGKNLSVIEMSGVILFLKIEKKIVTGSLWNFGLFFVSRGGYYSISNIILVLYLQP